MDYVRAMNPLRERLATSPIHARVLPYIFILALTFLQDSLGETNRYWLYLAKMLFGAWCVYEMRSLVPEMRWAFSWEAVAAGVIVLVIWVALDPFYPKFEVLFKLGKPWNPFAHFGEGSAMGWFFFWVRTLGSAIIIPPLEEVFYRSFLYRYAVRTDFENMPMSKFHPTSFIVIALVFGLVHYQWIAGVLCAMIYQALVIRKGRLGDAMLAHAVTNFLLGLWIYFKGGSAWAFW